MRRLYKGGVYSRAAFIRGRRLFEGGVYSRAAFIQGLRLFEGGVCFGITFLKSLTTVTVNCFLTIMYFKGSNVSLILLR